MTACERLAQTDWAFPFRGTGHPIESIHPYPAKFISDIPRTLLDALRIPEGTAVLDPFCGSGATLVEAQRVGAPSVGIDLNPIACLMSRVKTKPLPMGFEGAATEIVDRARKNKQPHRRHIPHVDHWFKPDVQDVVTALVDEIRYVADSSDDLQDALNLALSSILVRVSNQESDTRYAAIDKPITGDAVYGLFRAACLKIASALAERDWSYPPARVIQGDTLRVTQLEIGFPVGIVITSPPYPNAYEYWLYHKYRMWWLGFDPITVKEQEIGARPHFFKKQNHTEENFRDQMRRVINLIDDVLVRSGTACFVIGRSKIHGRIVDNADIIEGVAKERGFACLTRFDRPIAARRKSFNLAHANIKTETILILQRDKV